MWQKKKMKNKHQLVLCKYKPCGYFQILCIQVCTGGFYQFNIYHSIEGHCTELLPQNKHQIFFDNIVFFSILLFYSKRVPVTPPGKSPSQGSLTDEQVNFYIKCTAFSPMSICWQLVVFLPTVKYLKKLYWSTRHECFITKCRHS